MTGTAEDVIAAYAGKGLVIDTHIVLLYVVGSYDKTLIQRFKRTKSYTPDDFDMLEALIGFFSRIVVTPHILAEVNSLLRQLGEPARSECFQGEFFRLIEIVHEQYVPSQIAAANPLTARLGLSDGTICEIARDFAVLTDDFPLFGTLENMGMPVINFTHLRNFDQ